MAEKEGKKERGKERGRSRDTNPPPQIHISGNATAVWSYQVVGVSITISNHSTQQIQQFFLRSIHFLQYRSTRAHTCTCLSIICQSINYLLSLKLGIRPIEHRQNMQKP